MPHPLDAGRQEVFARAIDVSSVDRTVFPDTGTTKGEVVGYYARIAEMMIPHLLRRPVAVKRYPDLFRRLGQRDDPWAQDLPRASADTLRANLDALDDTR